MIAFREVLSRPSPLLLADIVGYARRTNEYQKSSCLIEATGLVPVEKGFLSVKLSGDLKGYPVVFLHGTPNTKDGVQPSAKELYKKGVLAILPDRMGFGQSSPVPDDRETLAEEADD